MTGFRLQLKKLSDGRLIFTIPIGYKLLLLAIGLLILISLIVTREQGAGSIFMRENTIPLIIGLISLLGAAYHERWVFDKAGAQVIHQNGLIVLHGNKVFRIADLERIEVRRFGMARKKEAKNLTGRMSFPQVWALSILEKTGKIHTIETFRRSQLSRAERAANTISDYCGLAMRTLKAVSYTHLTLPTN